MKAWRFTCRREGIWVLLLCLKGPGEAGSEAEEAWQGRRPHGLGEDQERGLD